MSLEPNIKLFSTKRIISRNPYFNFVNIRSSSAYITLNLTSNSRKSYY